MRKVEKELVLVKLLHHHHFYHPDYVVITKISGSDKRGVRTFELVIHTASIPFKQPRSTSGKTATFTIMRMRNRKRC